MHCSAIFKFLRAQKVHFVHACPRVSIIEHKAINDVKVFLRERFVVALNFIICRQARGLAAEETPLRTGRNNILKGDVRALGRFIAILK